jgi:hypothetical protein
LLWAVPILIIFGGAYVAGLIAWIATIGGLASTKNQSAAGMGALLGFCGFFCCLFLLGILIAMVVGIFQPLMYQSAVQGRRRLGRAASEGWTLARQHVGSMFIFWLLTILIAIAGRLVTALVGYPLSAAVWGNYLAWITSVMQNTESHAPYFPLAFPAIAPSVMWGALLAEGVVGLLFYSFMQTFALTMYAAVYRHFVGAPLVLNPPTQPLPGPATRPGTPTLRDADGPTTQSGQSRGDAESSARSGRLIPPAALSVPDEEPPKGESRPHL